MKHAQPKHAQPASLKIPRMNRRQAGIMVLTGIGAAVGLSTAGASSSDIREVSPDQRAADTQTLLSLMNTFRAENGVGPLNHSTTLAAVMEPEARRQVAAGAVAHGTSFLNDSRVQGNTFAREIIALSYNDDLNELLNFWKGSAAHRTALLSAEANVCGIGLAYGHGTGLPWRILGNVGLWGFPGGGPADTSVQSNSVTEVSEEELAGERVTDQPDTGSQASQPEDEAAQTGQQKTAEPIEITGAIAERYYADGGEAVYGPATASALPTETGGSYQIFEKDGARTIILWSRATGAWAVRLSGPLGQAWTKAGSEKGYGYPTSNEYRFGIYTLQDFEAAVLARNSLTGAIEVR